MGSVMINSALEDFLTNGVSVVLGTRDAGLVPELVRAWGPCVRRDQRTIELCVAFGAARKTLENLYDNSHAAVAFCNVTNYKTIQLKGRCVKIADADSDNLAAVERHREAFARQNESFGVPRRFVEDFWRREAGGSALVKIVVVIEQLYDQTPGPGAGAAI